MPRRAPWTWISVVRASPLAFRRIGGLARLIPALMVSLLVGGALLAATSAHAGTATPPRLAVVGNKLTSAGTTTALRLAGVNRSGSEYACIQGWGMFDGPVDDAAISAIAAWHTNVVRVPLNEDCWLGINGSPAKYSGTAYRAAIASLVNRLHSRGLAAILDLHWAAPGAAKSTSQLVAPDASHTVAFWTSVATMFKSDSSVAFELFNEPHDISWACWRDGCTTSSGWQSVGMQQLVTAVRRTGATQPLILDGLNWGGDLTQFNSYAPTDPAHAIVAGWHIYNFSGCNTAACWNSSAAQVATRYPVLLTELGENDCAAAFMNRMLPWADSHGIGYLAWSWNTASCGGGPALISDYSGTPNAFGAAYRAHLARLTAAPAPAPVISSAPVSTPSSIASPAPVASPTQATTSVPTSPVAPQALADFEDGGTDSWAPLWGSVGVSNEDGIAVSGSHGLKLTLSQGGYAAVGADVRSDSVGAGTSVTYRVWAPSALPVTASPVLYDQNWVVTVLPSRPLAAGWNTITFVVPARLSSVRVLGVQLSNPQAWTGAVVLDDVRVG
jgi:endoglucanase